VLIALAAYYNSFHGPEILDDSASISRNPYIRRLWPITSAMRAPAQQTTAGRPIVCLSLAINYAVSKWLTDGRTGLDVTGYHVFNLVVHILAGLTLFGIVRRTLRTDRLRDSFGKHADILALICAAIWLAHPLQTAAVTYMIQRAESMMGLFYLLTMYCAIRGFHSRRAVLWYAAAAIFSGLGMGTKEVMVTAPLMVLIYDRIFIARSTREAGPKRAWLYGPLAASWVILAALVWSGPRSSSAGLGLSISPIQYAQAQCGIIIHYIRLAFWPNPLVLDYDWPMPSTLMQVAGPAAGLAALLAATVLALRYRPAVGFAGVWFFLILAPTSSLLPIKDLAFEHRMYLPLAAVVVVVVLTVAWLVGRLARWHRPAAAIALVLAGTVTATLAWRTHVRNLDYRSRYSIWLDTVAKAPHNPRAHNNLGYAIRQMGRQHYADAIRQYNKAIELDPHYVQAYNNRGAVYGFLGRPDRAMEDFNAAIRLSPESPKPYCNRAITYILKGRFEQAIRDLDTAIRIKPDYATAYVRRGQAEVALGRADKAIADYDQALRIMPDLAEARRLRAQAMAIRDGENRPRNPAESRNPAEMHPSGTPQNQPSERKLP